MKIRYIKYWAFAAVLGMGTVSCEDFLNRPTEDNYNESNFYQNDEQCVQGVNLRGKKRCVSKFGRSENI